MTTTTSVWPELPLGQWKDTYETLHVCIQVIGKIRLNNGSSVILLPNMLSLVCYLNNIEVVTNSRITKS
jgi:hypothetical protein